MSNPYVPENDRLEQEAEVAGDRPPEDRPDEGSSGLDYPETLPPEAPEADAMDQAREVPQDDEEEQL